MNLGDEVRSLIEALELQGNPFVRQNVGWVSQLEAIFGREFPASFRELIANYAFPEFDVAGVTVFSNLNDGSHMDITVVPFSDPYMSPWLRKHGFMQFGRPDTGSYDPVCLDLSSSQLDPPVVVIDHEDILIEQKRMYVAELSTSFVELLRAGVHNKRLQPIARENARSG